MHRQEGHALVEWMLAALLATLLTVWGAGALVHRLDDSAAQSGAAWMLTVKKAVRLYIERYDQVLMKAVDFTELAHKGYANWSAPSVAELRADGLLSAGFPEHGPRALAVSVLLMRRGACPGADCRLDALLYSNQALVQRGSQPIDETMVAQWLLASEGWGGTVSRQRPDHIAGASFGFANPPVPGMAALPVGTLAMAMTAEQLGSSDYLRVGDERDPDFHGSASVAGDIKTGGSLSAQKYLKLGAQETAFTSCSENGAVARQYYGGLLVCRDNLWRLSGGGGGGFSVNTLYGCRSSSGSPTANPVTGSCSCPLDYSMVAISDSGNHPPPDGRTMGYICVE
ncbi:hypothetical protein [Paralcaligenes ureilyticus]|uniref:Shufflon protein n=1 Tax=Paralcaligenes ureilyticus TaxID=627131 RepID=A0A4R3LXJ6_9BURK|nr:hypothetical protein [Paralcaligenes ureilyticus]TCT05351.1 hypothetical protein EDC26_11091 [Paralcaligenes ureilyticus]